MPDDLAELIALLRSTGTITSAAPQLTPLSGGVSSEIYLIEDGARKFVLKRALAKLKVREDWFADVSRNRAEQAFLRYVGGILPAAVPRLLEGHPEHGFFTMEFLGDGFANWKQQLLGGDADLEIARRAGEVLGTIHQSSFGMEQRAAEFNSPENFWQLRLDPYLRHTAQRHPDLAPRIDTEAKRLAASRDCLIHGDFSPKNILYSADRLVLLDCEVACFGDPVFDTAFLLNHFFLKSLHHHPRPFPLAELVTAFWTAYIEVRGEPARNGLEVRTTRLLPMLMLARVDGKSPVEYLTQPVRQDFLRRFAREAIAEEPEPLGTFTRHWLDALTISQIEPS